MNRSDLVSAVAESCKEDRKTVEAIVNATFSAIIDTRAIVKSCVFKF